MMMLDFVIFMKQENKVKKDNTERLPNNLLAEVPIYSVFSVQGFDCSWL